LKYGSMIDNVIEITVIDGNGNRVVLPNNKKISNKIQKKIKTDTTKIPNVSKNSSGYRIDKITSKNETHKIIIGSEGTLGIVISAKLKIKNIPKKRILFVIEYDSTKKAIRYCTLVKKQTHRQ